MEKSIFLESKGSIIFTTVVFTTLGIATLANNQPQSFHFILGTLIIVFSLLNGSQLIFGFSTNSKHAAILRVTAEVIEFRPYYMGSLTTLHWKEIKSITLKPSKIEFKLSKGRKFIKYNAGYKRSEELLDLLKTSAEQHHIELIIS
ncbi:MAG: hypothetical protein ABJG47_12355 [Ekhidna sp.]